MRQPVSDRIGGGQDEDQDPGPHQQSREARHQRESPIECTTFEPHSGPKVLRLSHDGYQVQLSEGGTQDQ